MKFPGWYPSIQYPGKMQWWDGYQFTDDTRYMEPHERYDRSIGEPKEDLFKEKPKIVLDWLFFLPLMAALVSLFWLGFSLVPFATGERTVTYEKVNATITRVETKVTYSDTSKKIGAYSNRTCIVHVNAVINDQHYPATAGNNCSRETGVKTEMTYDPKDIQGTLSSAPMPSAQMNTVAAFSSLVVFLCSLGLLTWMRRPLVEVKPVKTNKKRKRRNS